MNISTSTHELFVVSDNRYNHYSAPTYTGGDFYHFGGIQRNVLIHTLNLPNKVNNSLLRVEAFPIDYIKGIININITFTYKFHDDETKYFRLTFDKKKEGNNNTIFNVSSDVKKDEQYAILTNIGVPSVKLWSLQTPNLHTLLVEYVDNQYKNAYDSIEIRFGLRVLGIDPKSTRITLNGEIIKFHGYNRHTMFGGTGSALTYPQIQQDIVLIKEVGANYIRGAHYPQDQRFLDLCDENGVAVWSETLGPGVTVSTLQDPYFMKYQIQAINEMIDAGINNPSIVWWAFYNEGQSNKNGSIPWI